MGLVPATAGAVKVWLRHQADRVPSALLPVTAMLAMILVIKNPASSRGPVEGETQGDSAQTRLQHSPFVKVFAGPHTPKKLSEILITEPLTWKTSRERLAAVAAGAKLGDVLAGALTLEWEGLYIFHWGSQRFHEAGGALYARWNRFAWNGYVPTTLAVGVGPSITSEAARYEPKDGRRSSWLTQFNIEINLYLPGDPRWALVLRIQHRSGVFGLINKVFGGSNFLTVGVRRQF